MKSHFYLRRLAPAVALRKRLNGLLIKEFDGKVCKPKILEN